jgi:hypothetical protein
MLRTNIREFVNNAQFTTLAGVIEAARSREIELDTQSKKRKAAESSGTNQTFNKRSKFTGSQGGHKGGSKDSEYRCHRCGQTGHKIKECTKTVVVCYGCGQQGHVRSQCPALQGGGIPARPVNSSNPPLRITDGRAGTTQPPKATGRVFHLSAEKAQATPDVVTGIV